MDHAQLFEALPAPIEAALRASIERFGVLVPIVYDQHGRLIDGRHRKRIADQLGVSYRPDTITVRNRAEADEIQRTLNADRRHLNEHQRREIAISLRGDGHSVRAIAGALGVGKSTVADDLKAAELSGAGQFPDRVRGLDGKERPAHRPTIVPGRNMRDRERAQAALTTMGDDAPGRVIDVRRAERIAREQQADRRRAEPLGGIIPTADISSVDIRHGDFRNELTDLSDVDAIITDPPYPREYLGLYGDLSELASRILAPHGVLVVMTGQWWLREYLAELDKHLSYRWTAAYIAQGARTRVHAARVGTGWKPLLVYQRHDAADVPFLVDDLFDAATTSAQTNGDKRFHEWGQNEAGIAEQVERFTVPGQLVVDPSALVLTNSPVVLARSGR